MFKYDENEKEIYNDISRSTKNELTEIATNTSNEEEMFEITKTNNPFLMRALAKNKNITKKVSIYILKEYTAYTMCTILAKNNIVDEEIKNLLYSIAIEGIYKDSMLKQDLDIIFK